MKTLLPPRHLKTAAVLLLPAPAMFLAACAKPLQPSQLYYDVGQGVVGGPMRLAKEKPIPRTPPMLPHVVKIDPEEALGQQQEQPPPPPADNTNVTTSPEVASAPQQGIPGSPVPPEADAYFQQPPPPPTSALGALFQAIFQPPPPPPPTSSSATYQVVP